MTIWVEWDNAATILMLYLCQMKTQEIISRIIKKRDYKGIAYKGRTSHKCPEQTSLKTDHPRMSCPGSPCLELHELVLFKCRILNLILKCTHMCTHTRMHTDTPIYGTVTTSSLGLKLRDRIRLPSGLQDLPLHKNMDRRLFMSASSWARGK